MLVNDQIKALLKGIRNWGVAKFAAINHNHDDVYAPLTHSHAIADVTGLQNVLNTKADLENGKVPTSQLPSYVDDVIEGYYHDGKFYEDDAYTTEITPETGKIYVDLSSNKTYRWSGTQYVQIKGDLVIGTTTGTAMDGGIGTTHINDSDIHTTSEEKAAWDAKLDDADSDGKTYARKDGEWVEVTSPDLTPYATLEYVQTQVEEPIAEKFVEVDDKFTQVDIDIDALELVALTSAQKALVVELNSLTHTEVTDYMNSLDE